MIEFVNATLATFDPGPGRWLAFILIWFIFATLAFWAGFSAVLLICKAVITILIRLGLKEAPYYVHKKHNRVD